MKTSVRKQIGKTKKNPLERVQELNEFLKTVGVKKKTNERMRIVVGPSGKILINLPNKEKHEQNE